MSGKKMTNPSQMTVSLANGRKLAGITNKQMDKTPLLALHGWLDNAHSFLPLLPYLNDYYLIALDMPGHGCSDHWPLDTNNHIFNYVLDIFAAADALKWKKFSILGHSLGACVAVLMAGTLADRIDHLYLIDGLSPSTEPSETAADQLKKYMKNMQYTARKKTLYPDIDTAANLRADGSELSLESAKLLSERGMIKKDDGYVWQHDSRLAFPSMVRLTEPQNLSFLQAITAKVKLVIAQEGQAVDKIQMKKDAHFLKNVNIVELPGKHYLHMETPEQVAYSLF